MAKLQLMPMVLWLQPKKKRERERGKKDNWRWCEVYDIANNAKI